MKLKNLALAGLALSLGLGCLKPDVNPAPTQSAYTPRFQYEVPKAAIPGSAKATVAIVTYQGETGLQLTTFQARFIADLQNVLVARGFSVKGPFATKDEMTFSDKKGSDFILLYSIAAQNRFLTAAVTGEGRPSSLVPAEENRLWNGTYSNLLGVSVKNISGSAAYFHGTLAVDAKINLTLVESMTGEKLWTKTLDISSDPEGFDTAQAHALGRGEAPLAAMQAATFDLGMVNAVNRSLDGIYNNGFKAVWNHLDPQELMEIKKQADEIKSKKVF